MSDIDEARVQRAANAMALEIERITARDGTYNLWGKTKPFDDPTPRPKLKGISLDDLARIALETK